jgi:multidrug efflux system membrane fusion protein
MRHFLLASVAVALALCVDCSNGRDPQSGRAATKEAVPVVIGTVIQKDLPVELRVIGNVQPYSSVAVKSQVNGEVKKVHFVEGQDVKQGDLLFTVNPRPFEVALQAAEANRRQAQSNLAQGEAKLVQDQAEMRNAEAEANRYAQLFKAGVAAAEVSEQYRTKAESLRAAVQADAAALQSERAAIEASEAAIEITRVQLGYTKITASMDGRTGNLIVYPGNIVKALEAPALVTINQIHPIYVAFSVPGQDLAEIKRRMAGGRLRVEAHPKNGGAVSTGELTFVDNAIDMATSTIQLKGTFANHDNVLWPGEFVDVTLVLGVQKDAVIAPAPAIQNGQQGQYVFVVRPDQTVENRPVVVARATEHESVIEKGLAPGEKVVTDGQLRLAPGAKIKAVER